EASLATALAALVLVLEPTWLATVFRLWLGAIALLGSGAILSTVFGRIPTEPAPASTQQARQLGDLRQMRDIEQANDFLIAVDYQLFPFLQGAVRDIAAQRLLVSHNVDLEREPDRARDILGQETWRLITPMETAGGKPRLGSVSLAQLAVVTDALEKL
ncbi:MAG: hypothetical protein ACHP7P_14470, partial [Terriglobales bacterium]